MNQCDSALAADARGDLLAAFEAYGPCLSSQEATLEQHLDAAIVCLQLCEPGKIARLHLDGDAVERAWKRLNEILAIAEVRFGGHPEVGFWKYYVQFHFLGGGADKEYALACVADGETTIPYFHLFALSDNKEFRVEAEALYQHMKDGKTARQRYVCEFLSEFSARPRRAR